MSHGRLVWFGEVPDPAYWTTHWQEQLDQGLLDPDRLPSDGTDELMTIICRRLDPDGRHLEAGCGAGQYVAALQAAGYQVDGVDNAADLIARVHRVDPELSVLAGDVLRVPVRDGAYDGYVSIGVVEHRQEGPEPFLAEAWRVLRPGGVAIISVPAFGEVRRLKARLGRYRGAEPVQPFYQFGFRGSELRSLLEQAGFEVEAVLPHYAHRMLVEELAPYRWLMTKRGARLAKQATVGLLKGRDGHMVVAVARKA